VPSSTLENKGETVSREQLREQVWGEGTFVDFEHGLNAAINKAPGSVSRRDHLED